jgi:hypothetical protein
VRIGNGEQGSGSDEEVDVEPPVHTLVRQSQVLKLPGDNVAPTRLTMPVSADSKIERERELLSIHHTRPTKWTLIIWKRNIPGIHTCN